MSTIDENITAEAERHLNLILFQDSLYKTLQNMIKIREVSSLCISGPEGCGQGLAAEFLSIMTGDGGKYLTINPYEIDRKDPIKVKNLLESYFNQHEENIIRIIKTDILNTNPNIYLILDLLKNYLKQPNPKIILIEGDSEAISFLNAASPDLFLKLKHAKVRSFTKFELIELLTILLERKGYIIDSGFKRNIKDLMEQVRPVGDLVNARIVDNMANLSINKAKLLGANSIRAEYIDRNLFKTINRRNLTGYEELDSLIGLDDVKDTVKLWMANSNLAKRREKLGLVAPGAGQHMVFKGPAGTAKTSVARIVGKILAETGVLNSGHLIEVQKADLIADSAEQSTRNVTDYVKKSIGGVLFIDEAYALTVKDREEADYSKEVIDTLLKLMEDYRDSFVVIAAGYPSNMEQFLNSNPGLRSRFMRVLEFPGYDIEQLFQILDYMVTSRGFILDEKVKSALKPRLELVSQYPGFGNGRHIRNILDKAIVQQGYRVTEDSTDEEFKTLTVEDFKEALTAQVLS
jgi:AAA+ superfamily predicted ATPase